MNLTQTQTRIAWTAQIIAAIIMGQTLFFKFTGAPEAVALFTKLGVEPFGRIGLGVVELIAVILLLVPRTAAIGSAVTLGLMVGAIGSHLTKIGIEVEGDGGALFTMAVIAFIAGLTATWIRRRELPVLGAMFHTSAADA